MKKQSFITGAALLAVATGLGKLFSAIFKIPLDRFFLHAEGMAVFNSAYNVYMFFYAVATAGIPLAISKLVAQASTKDEEQSILSTSVMSTLCLLGAGGLVIFIFADKIALMTGMADAAVSFRVMAPALIFCSVTASLRGYFQGMRMMLPSALSQLSDSFGRLLGGFLLAYLLMGSSMAIACGGAISGVPLGAFLSAAVLVYFFRKSGGKLTAVFSGKVFKSLVFLAAPITLTASMHPVFNMVDTVTVVPFLTYISSSAPQTAFGCLSRAATLYALPVSIATSVAASILPAVAENAKNNDRKALLADSSLALRLAFTLSVPCAAGFMAIPEGILNFLFDNSLNYHTLAIIAPSAVFLSAASVLASILQGLGHTKSTVIAALSGVAAKCILNPVMMYLWGINGAAAATACAYFAFFVLLFIFTQRLGGIKFGVLSVAVKPLFCGTVCYLTAFITAQFLPVFAVIMISALFYIASVFSVKLITKSEIYQIFSA